ncbi:hypothetical protein OfM1_19240 [Lactovum odontotermitis]
MGMFDKLGGAIVAGASLALAVSANADTQMFRMYNPNSGEHFYTAKEAERSKLMNVGWYYEGIGWVAPDSGAPVYRLYNPNAGDHHYTTNAYEKDELVKAGWNDEGIGWYSGGSVKLYRDYNPNAIAGAHNYTTSLFEAQSLVKAGWNDEGIAWFGVAEGTPAAEIGAEVPVITPTPIVSTEPRVSDGWSIAAPGKVYVHKESGVAYTRVKNPENYNYTSWMNQERPANGGNGSAQFIESDLTGSN